MSQFYPVILHIGARIIEAGFAGDPYPIVRKATNSYTLARLLNTDYSHAVPENIIEQSKFAEHKQEENILWSYDLINNDISVLENVLERIVHDIYTNYLLVDPKRCKVLFIEPPFFPKPLKQVVTKVLLFHMHAQSISFCAEPLMSCVSSGSDSGLIINLGWSQTTITPVYDLRMIYSKIKVTNRSGRMIHDELLETFNQCEGISEKFTFDLIERFIFESTYSRTSNLEEEDRKMYKFDGVDIPNKIRYEILEGVLFGKNAEDDNNESITSLIRSLVDELDIDLRVDLFSNIIITGGISNIAGVKTRLLQEIKQEMKKSSLQIQSIVALGPWEGSSLYCSTALMSSSSTEAQHGKSNELQRNKYLSGESQLIDWIDELYLDRS